MNPLEELHDIFIHKKSPSLGFDDSVIPNPLDHSHVSPMYLRPSHYPKCDIVEPIDNSMICNANIDLGCDDKMFNILGGNIDNFLSLGYFSGYNASLDPYCMCLGDLPKKIMWSTIFNPSYDFSIAIDKVKRILVVFGVILVIASYLLFSELWSRSLISSCVL